MKIQSKLLALALCAIALTTARLSLADPVINIIGTNRSEYVVPISVTGFSGETLSVVRFDLEVLGMEVVSPEKADFIVSGSNGADKLEGKLTDRNHTVIGGVNKIYQGGSPRTLAHIFAQDVVNVIRPGLKPIFNGRIAFKLEQGRNSEIAVSDWDGDKATQATRDGSLVNAPSWAPGRPVLFYASWKNGPIQILEHNVTTGERNAFAKYPGANYSPSVSPDGRKVAMVLNKRGQLDLYVCDIDGSNLKQLTFTADEESSPCWSPDSRTLCYTSRKGRAGLYKVSVNGGPEQKLAIGGAYGHITEPDWSPDGKTIVFTSNSGGFNLYAVPAGGGEAEHLVEGEDGAWAPNSRTVIFTRRVGERRVLSLLDVPTKRFKDVPEKLSGNKSQPDWAQ